MKSNKKSYIAIDLKSFYASVECVERGLDPLKTNLVVADPERTEKTICLAVSPSLKSFGISGRARLFEVIEKVREVNFLRKSTAPDGRLSGESWDFTELANDPAKAVSYITAPPQMALYMKYSTKIYGIYLKYIAPEDIHVYSVDEVFIDATHYLKKYGLAPEELARTMIKDVFYSTGITATAGVGENLYLCKVAMDILAKKCEPDENGVRIATLTEESYRRLLWNHEPITDFWRVGRGYSEKLRQYGIYTMGDVAKCSVGKENTFYNEDLLYKLFGVNAELLIDHAWGYENCTIEDIKAYRPLSNSLSSGQVLKHPYTAEKTKLIVKEMTELLVLQLVEKGVCTNQIVLTIGYDIENLKSAELRAGYSGEITTDRYGRNIPKHSHGTGNLGEYTSSTKAIMKCVTELFDRITNPELLVRRVTICANNIIFEENIPADEAVQLDLFTDYNAFEKREKDRENALEKERNMQKAMLKIKKKYGKNAILKGMNFLDGGTAIERNGQIGGHRA